MRIRSILILLTATLLAAAPAAAAAEIAVIAHPSVGVDSIDADTIQAYYLGKQRDWPDGSKVVLTVNESAAHAAFLEAYIGKNPSGFTSFWKRIVFTGKGKMPDSFADDQAVLARVAATPGAIGYIDAAALSDQVKRLKVP